ncbi:MAG: HAD-IB family hydrolase [Pseudomonadales bacterium]|nr:HAD-IB family hydrolase [Pseudomonadales bacterium]
MKISVDEHVASIALVSGADASPVNFASTELEPPVIAFFDLDRTLIDGYSLTALAWQQIFTLRMSVPRFIKLSIMFSKYGLGQLSYAEMLEATIDDIKGMPEQNLIDLAQESYEQRLKHWIYRDGFELVQSHKKRGHHVVLVTSATSYQSSAIAELFGFDQVYCTELEIVDERIAGGVAPCYGAGIVARGYCTEVGGDLSNAYFYSDSPDDMPLLEQVGHPVVVNAKKKLAKLIEGRNWPAIQFDKKGLP